MRRKGVIVSNRDIKTVLYRPESNVGIVVQATGRLISATMICSIKRAAQIFATGEAEPDTERQVFYSTPRLTEGLVLPVLLLGTTKYYSKAIFKPNLFNFVMISVELCKMERACCIPVGMHVRIRSNIK